MRDDDLELLFKSSFFQGLQPNVLSMFIKLGRLRTFEHKTCIFHEGDSPDFFYVLLEGEVKLTQVTPSGHQVIIQYLSPGDALGIIVVLSKMNYPVTAEVVQNCRTLTWNHSITTGFMQQHPQLALNGMNLIAARFAKLQDRYREMSTQRVEQRAAHVILGLVRQFGKKTSEGVLIDIPLSNQDIAEMTGTTLFTISRILRKWEQQKIVCLGRQRVVLSKPHDLVTIAE